MQNITLPTPRKGIIVGAPDLNVKDAAYELHNMNSSLDGTTVREGRYLYAPIQSEVSHSVIHGFLQDGKPILYTTNSEHLLRTSEVIENNRDRVDRTDATRARISGIASRRDWSNAISTTFTLADGTSVFILVHKDGITTIRPDPFNPTLNVKHFNAIQVDVAGTPTRLDLLRNPFKFITSFNRKLIFLDNHKFYYTQEVSAIPEGPGTRSSVDNEATTILEDFDLSPNFNGGELIWCEALSKDTGSGQEAFLVFMNSNGQFAVYQVGALSAGEIRLQGIYDLGGEPLGPYSFFQIDGDIHCITSNGIRSILQSVQSETGYLSASIQPLLLQTIQDNPGKNWFISRFHTAEDDYIIYSPQNARNPISFVFNIQMKAWSTWNISIDSSIDLAGTLYFTSGNGVYTLRNSQDETPIPAQDLRNFNIDWEIQTSPIEFREITRSNKLGSPLQKRIKRAEINYYSNTKIAYRAGCRDVTRLNDYIPAPAPQDNPITDIRHFSDTRSISGHGRRMIFEIVGSIQSSTPIRTSFSSKELLIEQGTTYR